MEIRVRGLEPGDEPAVAGLAGQLGYPSTPEQIRRRWTALQGREEHFTAVAVLHDNRPVGWVHAFLALRLQSQLFAEIGGMVVAEDHRSGGIGAAMLRAVEAWARSKTVTRIRVRSNVIRARAHDFYLNHGYEQGKTSHVFEKRLSS